MLGVYLADDFTTDPREVSFNDLSLRHTDEAKKAIEAVYREWMVPGETLTPRLKAEIDRRRAELGLRAPDRQFIWGPRLRRNPAIEAEFPELRQLPDGSPEWFRLWRKLHLQRYPNCDQETRDNLDLMVQQAENEAAGGLFD